MLIVNIGSQGMHKEIAGETTLEVKFFEPGVNVEVSDETGEYLLKKYSNKKMAIHFQEALNAQEHETVQAKAENPEPDAPDVPVVQPKKRGRKPKQK